ncbi:hypothetical protein WN51_03640 [Melipona quadrifasciata]|uniref:PiggyBac transposable element-derived protein domain-containing protein n=1 Tax=Melipona quadrifasciata TaxID=166423 RepID=A0A0M8ZXX7_9HYME|nr:hypothetical protein WN51_03640 [Melipona quadrifasciata]
MLVVRQNVQRAEESADQAPARTLRADERLAYHYTPVHKLIIPSDYQKRVQFCEWYMHSVVRDNVFSSRIISIDEASFRRRGIRNAYNHIWARNNPYAVKQRNFQHEFRCNIWMGIIND